MNNIETMLEAVSKKLGITPQKLKEAINKGDLSIALSNMSEKDAKKLNSILSDTETLKKVMNSKQAKELKKNMQK